MSKYTLIQSHTTDRSIQIETILTGLDFPKYYYFDNFESAQSFLLGPSFEGEICSETTSRTFRENGTVITKSVLKLY